MSQPTEFDPFEKYPKTYSTVQQHLELMSLSERNQACEVSKATLQEARGEYERAGDDNAKNTACRKFMDAWKIHDENVKALSQKLESLEASRPRTEDQTKRSKSAGTVKAYVVANADAFKKKGDNASLYMKVLRGLDEHVSRESNAAVAESLEKLVSLVTEGATCDFCACHFDFISVVVKALYAAHDEEAGSDFRLTGVMLREAADFAGTVASKQAYFQGLQSLVHYASLSPLQQAGVNLTSCASVTDVPVIYPAGKGVSTALRTAYGAKKAK